MRKLDRASATEPACLKRYQHGRDNWSTLDRDHKEEIRQQLEIMQGRRCAYCECCLNVFGQHIEHFRRKRVYPQLTFEWRNLFWSCDCSDRCGHYKDHGAGGYNPDDLIDPTSDDPDRYFRFYSNGTIAIREGLSEHEQHRAVETLRVFNLCPQAGPLRDIRMTHCMGYEQLGAELADLADAGDSTMLQAFLDEELNRIKGLPFETAVKHTLLPW